MSIGEYSYDGLLFLLVCVELFMFFIINIVVIIGNMFVVVVILRNRDF